MSKNTATLSTSSTPLTLDRSGIRPSGERRDEVRLAQHESAPPAGAAFVGFCGELARRHLRVELEPFFNLNDVIVECELVNV